MVFAAEPPPPPLFLLLYQKLIKFIQVTDALKTPFNQLVLLGVRYMQFPPPPTSSRKKIACAIGIKCYSTTNKLHLLSQIIYFCKTLYMFRTVFPSIIRSSELRIQQRYMSNNCCIRSCELLMMDGKTVRNM